MKVAAIVPARAGSKRLPGKNLRKVDGLSLVRRAAYAAFNFACWDAAFDFACWVSTDGDAIAAEAERCGARVVRRPAHLATDTSTTESVVEHWLRTMFAMSAPMPDVIVLIQASTPMLLPDCGASHVRGAVAALIDGGHDSIVAIEQSAHRAFDGRVYPRDGGLPEWRPWRPVMSRPRTQDVRPMGTECGAFWVFTRAHFEKTGCRQGGDCRAWLMPRWSVVDIDDETDLAAAEALAGRGM